ncbi:hypothetical protein BSZ35_03685 [Salinibacter sp. 10B]|nr:hypothetical protein BSZ35_03685 [Salinibacter sp. 10B]
MVEYNTENSKNKEDIDKRGEDTEYISIVRTDESFIEVGKSEDILIEATEFVILDYLSKHLDSYFNDVEEVDKEVTKIEREDIPKILIENRILSTLSKPLDERDAFVGSSILEGVPEGQEIVSVYGSNGTLYEKFELVLPRGTEIERPGPGKLRMENSRIVMSMAIKFDGMTKNLPRGFEDLYMNLDSEDVKPYKLDVEISVLIKRRALLQRSGWKYHEWVDSFSNKIENKMSFSEFVDRINWPIVMCHLRSFKGMMEGSPNRPNEDV